MIIFKLVLSAIILSGLIAVAFITVDGLTGLRYEWLDNMTQMFVQVFVCLMVMSFMVGLMIIGGLLICTLWNQM